MLPVPGDVARLDGRLACTEEDAGSSPAVSTSRPASAGHTRQVALEEDPMDGSETTGATLATTWSSSSNTLVLEDTGCAVQTGFVPFGENEAAAWLDEHGGAAAPQAGTLASLYAHAAGIELPEARPGGFTRRAVRPASIRSTARPASVVSTASTRPSYGRGVGSIPAGGSDD